MNFVSIDVETANAAMSSICQIGVAVYADGALAHEWKSYIDPQDYFDHVHISIHGITEDTVRGAPTIPGVAEQLSQLMASKIVVSHTHFDRVALRRAFEKHSIILPDCRWLDSAKVARRCWSDMSASGYGLRAVATALGYTFEHHDALEDAKAAGFVVVSAAREMAVDIEQLALRSLRPISITSPSSDMPEANSEGALFGEVLVFTGALEIPRKEAAAMAARIGCEVATSVTKKTSMLVVGDQDITKLAGQSKSSKHRAAEELIISGQRIKILGESDFRQLVRHAE